MDAEKNVITIDRHEWSLTSPAHHTEVDKAIAVANQHRSTLAAQGVRIGDVLVWAHDSTVVISFEAERPKNPKRRGMDVTTNDAESADA